MPVARRHQTGTSLAELLVSIFILALCSTMVLPAMLSMIREAGLKSAVLRVKGLLLLTQDGARTFSVNRGVKFSRVGNDWYYAVYEDTDGNGIRNEEILSGRDRLIEGPASLFEKGSVAGVGFPPDGILDPDTNEPMPASSAPVQFNNSTICSFSSTGSGTPGSVYLTDGVNAAMVRSSGSSGRIRVLYSTGNGWEQ